MLDKKAVREIAEKFAAEVQKILTPNAILIFGSYVNGNPNEYSDIDIAIVCNDFKGSWYDTMVELCGISRRISFDIEPHLIDENHDKSGFVEHVMKTGEYIYKAA
jgi:predicted nucleotidyltransferase